MLEPKVEPEDKKNLRVKRYNLWKGKRLQAQKMAKPSSSRMSGFASGRLEWRLFWRSRRCPTSARS